MIPVLFNILFFLIPLIFFKNTSELFEFNKIVTLYAFTSVITTVWIINSIKVKKFIFKKSILDWPLLIYLSIYLLSTLISIDPRTSWLGYYSRFNGGLISQICYAILYWSFVSNVSKNNVRRITNSVLAGISIASVLAILEHFGVFTTCAAIVYDNIHQPENKNILEKFITLSFYNKYNYLFAKSCWVQDVQSRVFSTLGQPNWLAALLVTVIPVTWGRIIENYKKEKQIDIKTVLAKNVIWITLFVIFFSTLLFTKSRSGLLAFGAEFIIFWGLLLWNQKKKYLKVFLSLLLITFALYIPIQNIKINSNPRTNTVVEPVLENGGTESGIIRKYVWIGAFEVFKHYPILGTGPETFAFSFPMFKPVGHNLTSEWDFIYNKAHNEFLNYLANTGILGFSAYLSLIVYSIIIIFKSSKYEYLAGYIAILATNFFGFSVVAVSLLFFIIPALALVETEDQKVITSKSKLDIYQYLSISFFVLVLMYFLYIIYGYWNADIKYSNGKIINRYGKTNDAAQSLRQALTFSKNEAVYISELALADGKDETAMTAFNLSPFNQNVRRILISNLVKNSGDKPENLITAEKIILDGISKAPNDPKLRYQLAILDLKISKNDAAMQNLQKSIELKSNYKESRYALGMVFKSLKQNDKAKIQFEYILKNIDPNDELTKKNLDELK